MAYKLHHREHVDLASETIQSSTLTLKGIHNIHSSDSLPLGMLSVGDGVPDDILQEHLQDTPSLLVDKTSNTEKVKAENENIITLASPEILFTPPLLANRRIAGLVIPCKKFQSQSYGKASHVPGCCPATPCGAS